jgi:septal ring factor EnvC (AmiA/AmiB activator)
LGANVSALGAAIGRGMSDAATSVSNAAGGLVASASRAAESVPALERAATMVLPSKKDEESRATRAMDTRELLEHQTAQIRGQDDALEGLDKLVENLKTTSEAIHSEVVLQAKLVEDLEADFSHTSDRMKKLRKQGFKLSGEKNEEEREKLDRKEVIDEMRAKLGREERSDDGGCVIQ